MRALLRWMKDQILTVIPWFFDLCILLLLYLLAVEFLPEEIQIGAFGVQELRRPKLWMGCVLLVPLILSQIGIGKIRNFFLYLLASAAVTAGMWLLFSDWFGAGLTFVIFLVRASARVKRGKILKEMREMPGETQEQMNVQLGEIPTILDVPRLPYLAVFGAVYLILILAGRHEYLLLVVALFLTDVALYLLYIYLDGMENFIGDRNQKANFPVRALRRIAGTMLFFLLLAVLLPGTFALLWPRDPMESLELSREGQAPQSREELPVDFVTEEPEILSTPSEDMMPEMKEPPVWLARLFQILEVILMAAVAVAVPAAVMVFLFRGMRRLVQYYSVEEEDQIIFLGKDQEEASDADRRKGRQREPFWGEHRSIRRKYKRAILRGLKGRGSHTRPTGCETPEELENAAGLVIEELHREYERARYNNTESEGRQWNR